MKRLWVKLLRGHKITEQATVPCTPDDVKDALQEVLREMDAPTPVWLNKHEREMDEFRRTVFTAGDFMESVRFDKLELELLDEEGTRRKSSDPRNAF